MPVNASSLYARNLQAFLDPFIDKEKKTLAIDWDDELAKGTAISRDGAIVSAMVAEALGGKSINAAAKPAPKRATSTRTTTKTAPAKRASAKAARAKRSAKTKAPAKRTSTTRKPMGGKTR